MFDRVPNGPLKNFEESKLEWQMMMRAFKLTDKLKIPQKIVSLDYVNQFEKLQLHGFSDTNQQN